MAQPTGKRPRRAASARYVKKPVPRAHRPKKNRAASGTYGTYGARGARGAHGSPGAHGAGVGGGVESDEDLSGTPATPTTAATATRGPRFAFCLDCGERYPLDAPGRHAGHLSLGAGPDYEGATVGATGAAESPSATAAVRSISIGEAATRAEPRWPTGWPGLDRLLGGGLVTHGVYLLSGSPGAGKSTITMQLASQLRLSGAAVLMASGEENEPQIGARAARLDVNLDDPGLRLLATDCFDDVRREVMALAGTEGDPDVVVVDSAQAMRLRTEPGSLGSVTQVRALGHHAVSLAKTTGRCVIVIAHVTKDGDIAGPQTLVHAVDAWLHLDRDTSDARWLKTPKNRFGPTSEVVALDMGPSGLRETRDPASLLLEDLAGEVGVAVGVAVVGDAAPVLVPVEAFVGDEEDGASLAPLGFEPRRLRFLVEALARHANIDLRDRPLRVKVPTVGGATLTDGGLDLAVCAALLSAYYRVALPPRWAAWGEASLSGVVQRASRPEARVDALRAAVASGPLARAGLQTGLQTGLPEGTDPGATGTAGAPEALPVVGAWVPLRTPQADGVALLPVRRLSELALYVARLPGASPLPVATVRVKVPAQDTEGGTVGGAVGGAVGAGKGRAKGGRRRIAVGTTDETAPDAYGTEIDPTGAVEADDEAAPWE